MDVAVVVSFWAVSMLFVLTPGVDWAYAIAVGLGHRSVMPGVTGMLSGHLLATLVVAAGVGGLIRQAPITLTILTVIGAAYLIWLGINTLTRPATIRIAADPVAERPWQQFANGFGVSGLNPKVFLLFLALLPQFARSTAPWPVSTQMLMLGLVHIVNCALVYTLVGIAAQRLLRARPHAARLVSRTSGVIMTLLGSWLIVEPLLQH